MWVGGGGGRRKRPRPLGLFCDRLEVPGCWKLYQVYGEVCVVGEGIPMVGLVHKPRVLALDIA